MIAETTVVLVILVGGCALVRTLGVTGWGLPFVGFLAGAGLLILTGLVQIVTPLPTTPTLTLAVSGVVPVGAWIALVRRRRDVSIPVLGAAGVLASVPVVVWLLRTANLVKYHIDTADYLVSATMIANGTYADGTVPLLLSKRLVGFPLLQAPASLAGEAYVRSVTPLLALATLGALAWLLRQGVSEPVGRRAGPVMFASLGVLLLLSTNRFVFHAFYLNGHLLMAACTLVVVGCGWLLARKAPSVPRRALIWLQVLALIVLAVTRREGPIFALFAVLPTVLSGSVSRRERAMLLVGLGGATTAYYAWALLLLRSRGIGAPSSVPALFVFGLLVLLASAVPIWHFVTRQPSRWLAAVEGMVWVALAGLAATDTELFTHNVRTTWQNLFGGVGSWGPGFAVLAVLVVVTLTAVRSPHGNALRFPVTTFLPLVFAGGFLREGGFIAANADSLNRVVIHIVPAAVLWVVAAAATGQWRWQERRSPEAVATSVEA